MRILRLVLALIISVSLSIGMAFSVSAAPTLYENYTTGGDANSANIYGANYVAQQFTSDTTSHTVTSVKLEVLKVATPTSITVEIWNADSVTHKPTTKIGGATYSTSGITTTYSLVEFTLTDAISLLPSTEYAIVVSCVGDNANYIQWHQDSGGGLANAIGSDSTDSGISWTIDAGGADYLFQIYGEVVFNVKGANVFKSYLTTGDWLIVVETVNDYPDYVDETIAPRMFQVQLLDVAVDTVIAATTLKYWGNSPCAIYLSATAVTPLTWGSVYRIRMIGTFTGTPSVIYPLTADDWVGSNLSFLDEWCLLAAKSMNEYDDNESTNPYTKRTSIGAEILTNAGGGYFIGGIPSIMDVRTDLFEMTVQTPNYDQGTADNVYDDLTTWQAQVGAIIVGDATVFGNVFGVTGKQALSLGLWLSYIFAILFVFASSKGSETVFAMVMCAPILFIGAHFRLIEMYIIGFMAALAILLFVVKMWFTK